MFNCSNLPLRKIPGQIDIALQSFEAALENTAEWKEIAVAKILNPVAYIEQQTENLDLLKFRWREYKLSHPNASDKIKNCEEKLQKIHSLLNLMAEVLLEGTSVERPVPLAEKVPTPVLAPWEQLKQAFEAGDDPDAMLASFDAFLANPDEYTELKDGECYLKGFSFHHCDCDAWGRMTSTKRLKAETLIVDDIDRRVPNKNERLLIASYGAGGLLEDLIIIGKLIRQKGFKNIKAIFADPYQQHENAQKFAAMLNKLPGVTVQAIYPPYIPTRDKLHAIYSTDFIALNKLDATCWMDVFHARENALEEEGRFYLFGDGAELILDKQGAFKDLSEGSDAFVEEVMAAPQVASLCNADRIKILVAKDSSTQLNFHLPRIAALVQRLGMQLGKPIDVQLYANDRFTSAYRLNAYGNELVLKNLSGKVDLTVKYHKESLTLDQQAKATYHIFLRELDKGMMKVNFGIT